MIAKWLSQCSLSLVFLGFPEFSAGVSCFNGFVVIDAVLCKGIDRIVVAVTAEINTFIAIE